METGKKLKVYVAGGSAERLTVVRPLIDRLIAAGVEVTHDWTRCEGWEREGTVDEVTVWAGEDLDGVRAADVVWYVASFEKSEGSHGELVAGLVLGKHVIVSGPYDTSGRLFPLLADEGFPTHEHALDAIVTRQAMADVAAAVEVP